MSDQTPRRVDSISALQSRFDLGQESINPHSPDSLLNFGAAFAPRTRTDYGFDWRRAVFTKLENLISNHPNPGDSRSYFPSDHRYSMTIFLPST